MEMGPGNLPKSMATSMSVHTKTTKRADTEGTSGLMDAFTKETLPKMSSNFFIYLRHGKGRLIYTDGK